MTLRLTLPEKYVNGPTKEVIKLFVDHYNKKHADTPIDMEALHLKIVGGNHLTREARVRDTMADRDECYLLGPTSNTSNPPAKRAATAQDKAATPAPDDAERDQD